MSIKGGTHASDAMSGGASRGGASGGRGWEDPLRRLLQSKRGRGDLCLGLCAVFALLLQLCEGGAFCKLATLGPFVIFFLCGMANELTDDDRPTRKERRLAARLEAAGHPIAELAKAVEVPLWGYAGGFKNWRPEDGFESGESREALWELASGHLEGFIEKAPDERALAIAAAARDFLRDQKEHDPLAAVSWFCSRFDEMEAAQASLGGDADMAFREAAVDAVLAALRNPRRETPDRDRAEAEEMARRAVLAGALPADAVDAVLMRKPAAGDGLTEEAKADAFVRAVVGFLDFLLERRRPEAAGAARYLLSV